MSNAFYALPSDDLASLVIAVTASAEDSGYPAENLIAEEPANPAKLTTPSGNWVLQFGSAIAPTATVLLYHNLDAALAVTLQANSSDSWGSPPFSQAFTIPAHHEDLWPVSPYIELVGAPSYAWWRLNISGTNSLDIDVGRLMLIGTLREFESHVQWSPTEEEDHGDLVLPTELDVETIYELGGKRRGLIADFLMSEDGSAELRSLRRATKGRNTPWLLIPFPEINDAWIVRFQEPRGSRTLIAPDSTSPNGLGFWQTMPFRVRELSRGMPWP